MITKDNKDLSVLEITPENYLVPRGEERFYHVKMEIKSFDQHTGERLSHPFIQKFTRVDFEGGMMSLLRQQGYDMVILHDPKAWMEQHAAELNKSKAQKEAEAKAKAEAEKEALKEQIRKELLAEMKAENDAKAEAEAKAKADAKAKAKAEAEAKAKAKAEAETKAKAEAGAPAAEEEPDLS